jgi:hypothetical protein
MLLGAGMIEAEACEYQVGGFIQGVIGAVPEMQIGVLECVRRLSYPVFDCFRGSTAGIRIHC